MFDELKTIVSQLREISSRINVKAFDGKAAAELVGIGDEIRRCGDSLRTVAVGQVERTNGWKGEGAKSISEWLATETDCPHYEAQTVVILANQLQNLPTMQAALRSGTLLSAQAVEVARGAIVDPNTETQLLNLATYATVRDLRDASSRVVAAATDEAARHKRIHNNRCSKTFTDQDGAFNLKARMTVANGALIMAALKPLQDEIFKAARKSCNHESNEAYAADALLALCAAKTASAARPTRANAVMNIRIDIDALKRGHTENGEICEIAGVGPIPVARAIEYLGEAFLKLLIMDGTDIRTIAHMGRAIPAKVRTGLEERDRVCQVPTCDVSKNLEIDHIIPFAEGGATSFENLVRLCKRHHLQKTYDGYRLERIEVEKASEARWAWRAPPDMRENG